MCAFPPSAPCCSDGGNPTELHGADYCVSATTGTLSDTTNTASAYVCEIDLFCSNGWSLYTDDGSEGKNSCVALNTGTFTYAQVRPGVRGAVFVCHCACACAVVCD